MHSNPDTSFTPHILTKSLLFLESVWLAIALSLCAFIAVKATAASPIPDIQLPQGFHIEHFATVPNARGMVLGGDTLFVGSMSAGKVYALPLEKNNQEYRPKQVLVIAKNLQLPTGVAYRHGSLYVSSVDRILRFDSINENLLSPPKPVDIGVQLPEKKWHGARMIAFSPDDWLYVAIGAPCNACKDLGYIIRMRPDGSAREIFSHGVRNSVGFDWHPESNELWFSDNGRDRLGDDLPPEEINRASDKALHFGFPYCHGGSIPDPQFGTQKECALFTPPAYTLGAHVAPLGIHFYRGKQFPAQYSGQLFVAEHGSWNRSKKAGYKVGLLRIKNNQAVSYEPFATGWLNNESVSGRPVAFATLPDGSLLVSDDFSGSIYRIYYADVLN